MHQSKSVWGIGLIVSMGFSYSAVLAQESPPTVKSKSLTSSSTFNHPAGVHDCGFLSHEKWVRDFDDAVERGEIPAPSTKRLPSFSPRIATATTTAPICIPTPIINDIFIFEDTNSLLLTDFSDGQLFNLMADATNALIAEHGDNFDFISFWVNFTADHTLGTAFYLGIENDVTGIGRPFFNSRPGMGIVGDNVEGFVMMWNINSGFWQPGSGSNAKFTRLVLGQEYEHRFGMFLPPLADGRVLQGNNGPCGRSAHWSFRVDGQGSGMEMPEWVGENPAVRAFGNLNFNTDIGGSVFSYTDLYLMGYVSPEEMDAGNSELRFLDDNDNCSSPYNGFISHFTASDIIETAGDRTPISINAQKNFHSGWVMIHLPGAPPTTLELEKATAILAQHSVDWALSTLGRGTMNNTLRPSCDPELSLRPVTAEGPHTIVGRQIIIPAGGNRITFDLSINSWTPNLLSEYSVKLDSATYASGEAGTLNPVITPSPTTGAFIDTDRSDFVFTGLTATTNVDTSTLDYVYTASVDLADSAADPLSRQHLGSLILDVPPDARGEFRINFASDLDTALFDNTGLPISPLILTGSKISIAPNNTTCELAEEILCDSITRIDNRYISSAPNPSYTCGILSNHDGTLWYKFVATESVARFNTCDSFSGDSTFAVYQGACGSLTELGCSEDDDCGITGFLGDLLLGGLTPGETYYIQLSAWSNSDRGLYEMDLSCSVIQPAAPVPNTEVPDAGFGISNRYLSFMGGTPGRLQFIRVTFQDLPPSLGSLEGQSKWLNAPFQMSENSGVVDPASAPTFGSFTAARLSCSPTAVDWGNIGEIKVFDEAIIPDSVYAVQIVDAGLENDPQAFSPPLLIRTSRWGDIVGNCMTIPCTAPDGTVNVVTDVTGILENFKNLPGSPHKSLSDIEPSIPDGIINFTDVTFALDGFRSFPYPFAPQTSPCP